MCFRSRESCVLVVLPLERLKYGGTLKKVVSDRVGGEFVGAMAGATEQPSTQKLA